MVAESRDLIVLGSGPGGYVAAIRASQLGRKVSIVERASLGGVCLNWGCIPTKALLSSASLFHNIKRASEFGINVSDATIDFPKIIDRSRATASKLSQGVQYLMKKNKVEIINGEGTLQKDRKLLVKDQSGNSVIYSFNDIIIATGARPKPIPGMNVDGSLIHSSRTLLECRKQPKRMLVIGAGAIGIEFAYFLHALGTKVTVVEMMEQILPFEDTEIARSLESVLTKQGMEIRTGAMVQKLQADDGKVSATIKKGDAEERWEGDCCLVAIGVTPNSENIGLEATGVAIERGFIKVDRFLRTNIPHHFAIGDVAGPPLLAHKASHEALTAAEAACGKLEHPMHYDNMPACTYCQPQVASVGLTERAVKDKGIKYRVGKIPFSAIGKAIATGEPEGLIKVIIDDELGEVLGVHILHAEATELISEAAVIRSHEGIASSVVETIHPHPTLSESIMEAMALSLGRPINV